MEGILISVHTGSTGSASKSYLPAKGLRKRIFLTLHGCLSNGVFFTLLRFSVIWLALPWEILHVSLLWTKMNEEWYTHRHAPHNLGSCPEKIMCKTEWPALKVASGIPNGYYPCIPMEIMQLGRYPLHKSTGVESQVSDAAAILHGCDSMLHLLNDLEQPRLRMGAIRWSRGRNHKVTSCLWKGWHIKISIAVSTRLFVYIISSYCQLP